MTDRLEAAAAPGAHAPLSWESIRGARGARPLVLICTEHRDGRLTILRTQPCGAQSETVLSRAQAAVFRHFLYTPPRLEAAPIPGKSGG